MKSMRLRVLSVVLGLLVASPAFASFHLMQIEQVTAGVGGDITAQAIQLRMRVLGENLVSNGRLRAWDANGANPVMIIDMTTNVAVNAAGTRVLIASAGMAGYLAPAVAPDFIMTNPIPANYLAAGSLTWEDNAGSFIYWRLSWGGASFTGTGAGSVTNDADGNFSPPVATALPFSGNKAVRFTGVASALSTNNLADYALTPGAATFTNNAGASGLVTLLPGSSAANGIDLFVTPPSGTTFKSFATDAIPPGFFDPGSDPFTGVVVLRGQPIAPGTLGPTDTIVRRKANLSLPTAGSSNSVPIEIVALSLVSATPITVSYNGGTSTETWNVAVALSGTQPQPTGTLQATASPCVTGEGGTFNETLPVLPKLIFTRVGPPATRILDFGTAARPPIQFNTGGGHWLNTDPGLNFVVAPPGLFVDHDLDAGTAAIGPLPPSTNFIPGGRADRCALGCAGPVSFSQRVTHEIAPTARQDLLAATTSCLADADGDGICDAADNCVAVANPTQTDTDNDGIGDACDNCGARYNPCQEDVNANNVGDICEVAGVGDLTGAGVMLSSPAPNPTSGAMSFAITLPAAAHVRLAIFDLRGRLVRNVVDESLSAGPHTFNLDTASGTRLGSGIYYLRLDAAGVQRQRTFSVVR